MHAQATDGVDTAKSNEGESYTRHRAWGGAGDLITADGESGMRNRRSQESPRLRERERDREKDKVAASFDRRNTRRNRSSHDQLKVVMLEEEQNEEVATKGRTSTEAPYEHQRGHAYPARVP